ncbi:NAD(P)-dependent oxidoreductase [Methylobacterium oryzihabitans]|uniref:NAD(P)-dependent oxidoreductase n=1 Tax=Methylobacterium oryzihabitans TaxID=2499852 RepID=A0A3S2VXE3_9HYPH|nr:NAD(P)-dependent oxidoreductase [Methylobacterium oryzihabitans]RVU19829.1 NAD(P)-dependent oxidoreductase [Methylobacterium oryzihabitans]
MTPTIAIVAPGAMGSALARRLTESGARVLTSLEGRGPESRRRAGAAGMEAADDATIVTEADILLSIVPPSEALDLARRFAGAIARAGRGPVFVDANAVGVDTVTAADELVSTAGGRFVDGAIIGLPPRPGETGPVLYLSGPHAGAVAALSGLGLRLRTIDGPVGAASALKLSYAGITKGLTAVATAMILAAERAGAGDALRAELAASQPALLSRFAATLPDMVPKAYRWVAEMEAIRDFVGTGFPESAIYDGAAGLYRRIAADRQGAGAEIAALDRFLAGGGQN